MDFKTYQQMARRTQNPALDDNQLCGHALAGLCSEVGEIMSLFQHQLQEGRPLDKKELGKEIGDTFWFIAELCDVFGLSMDKISEENIMKLRKRYPEGFDTERSINRHAIDSGA